mgnify:CR=1 FL=1
MSVPHRAVAGETEGEGGREEALLEVTVDRVEGSGAEEEGEGVVERATGVAAAAAGAGGSSQERWAGTGAEEAKAVVWRVAGWPVAGASAAVPMVRGKAEVAVEVGATMLPRRAHVGPTRPGRNRSPGRGCKSLRS